MKNETLLTALLMVGGAHNPESARKQARNLCVILGENPEEDICQAAVDGLLEVANAVGETAQAVRNGPCQMT